MIELEESQPQQEEQTQSSPPAAGPRIKVIGVGGAGGNTINSIIDEGYAQVEFIATNTDAQALHATNAATRIQLGSKSTKGIGTGANPELGKRAAEEDIEKIEEACRDADLVFLTGGLGGGTGSGALPVIARTLKEHNILSVALVTKPFSFEGKRRLDIAENTLEVLQREVDTLITIPNQKLLDLADQNVSLVNAFGMVNDIVSQFVKSISSIITQPGHINVDFADVKAIMKDMGMAVMGTGRASGENRTQEATMQAISSPLLENMDVSGAQNVLLNITGSENLGLHEVSQAASLIYEKADTNASIVLGSVINEHMGDDVMVTIIATGFHQPEQQSSQFAHHTPQKERIQPEQHQPEAPHSQPQQQDDLNIPAILRRKSAEHNNPHS